jgi:hypothetical protein
MKLSATFFATTALFSGVAWAIPPQLLSRRASQRHTNPLAPIEVPRTEAVEAPNNATIEYSGNWSGAVLVSPPSGETFSEVSGTFTVPSMLSAGTNVAAAAWVGIDGATFQTAILQGGVYFQSDSEGTATFGSFVEWWPNYATDIAQSDFPVSAGDVVTVNIVATTDKEGTVTLINETQNVTFSSPQTAPTKLAYLGGQNAEWIVEDYTQNGGIVPLANWGTLTFDKTSASTSARTLLDLSEATIYDIEQFNAILTSVAFNGDDSVSISYV